MPRAPFDQAWKAFTAAAVRASALPSAANAGDPVHVPLAPMPAKLTALRGADGASLPRGGDPYAKAKLASTTTVTVLHEEDARTLQRVEQVPAPVEVTVLRVQPGAKKDWTLTLEVHKRSKVEKVLLKNDGAKLEGGRFDVRLQLVFGAPAAGEARADLDGVRTIDVSDPHPDGTEDHARKVVVKGLDLPPLPLDVELRRPRIVRFVGVGLPPAQGRYEKKGAKPPPPSKPGSRVVVHQDWTVRLEWTVLGRFDRLELEPIGERPAVAKGDLVTGSLTLDPAVRAPLPSGAYTLVARGTDDAAPRHAAVVTAVGITRFALRSATVHQLEHTDCHTFDPKTGFHVSKPVDELLGRAGTFHAAQPAVPGLLHLGHPTHDATLWFGQVVGTLKPSVRYEWAVVGQDAIDITLDVRNQVTKDKKPLAPHDVTEATRKTGGHDIEHEARFSQPTVTYLEADLNVWEKGAKREPGSRLTCSVMRLRIDRPFPKIAEGDAGFGAYDGPRRLADGEAVSSWDHLHFVWGLEGDHMYNRLRLSLCEPGPGADEDHPLALLELDLKPRGQLYSSGDVAMPAPMPKALEGKHEVIAVADLVRPPTPAEKAKGETRPWVNTWRKELGIARRKVKVRLPVKQPAGVFPCVQIPLACPVNKALELRQKYLDSIAELARVREKYGVALRAAHFTKAVAERVIDPSFMSKLGPDDVWGNMRGWSGTTSPPATGYGDSWLKREIDRMEGEVQAALAATEAAAGKLIAFITSKTKLYGGRDFQGHLIDAHVEHVINPGKDADLAEKLYGVGAPATYDPAKKVYRQIDHALAVLTDCLFMTEVGRKFLEETTDKAKLKTDYLAFDAVWDFVGKVAGVTEPVGKIIYNVSLAHHFSIRQWTHHQVNAFVQHKLLPSDRLQQFVGFIGERLGKTIDVEKALYEKALDLTDKSKALREHLRSSPVKLDDLEKYSKTNAGAAANLGGKWFSFALDSMALAITLHKAAYDWKGEFKDYAAIAKDLFGLVKSSAELARGQILSRGAFLEKEASAAYLKTLSTRAANAEWVASRAGFAVAVLGVVISAMDAYEGFKSKDWDKVVLHSAAAIATVVGVFLPGVGALLGLAIAVTMVFVFDHPVVDWLEDTPWGEDAVFTIDEVIDKFYAAMYDVDIYGKRLLDYDSNQDAVIVVSGLLGPAPVEVYLTVVVDGTSHTARVKLTDSKAPGGGKLTIDGKGRVQWPDQLMAEGKPRFRLFEAWDVFPNIKRTDKDHEVEVAVYPDKDTKPLKKKATITFRRPPRPRLDQISGHYWGLPGERQKRVGKTATGAEYFQVDPGQEVTEVSFRAQFADGCKVKVQLYKTDWALWKGDLLDETTVVVVDKAAGSGTATSVVTKAKLTFKLPAADDDYTGQLWLVLHDRDGKELEDRVSGKFKVARSAYIAKKG
ncbi:MAG: hypothetical protein KF878_07015 [Planctomycetes bacterium]|nr:hypothetical protein [Planctomycetota bacterium]